MRALAAGFAFALVACARAPQTAPSPPAGPLVNLTIAPRVPTAKRVSSAPVAEMTAQVAVTKAPGPALAAVTTGPSPTVSATASAAPRIYSITPPGVVHAGQSVTWDVRTTPNVVSVRAHVSAYSFPLAQTGPGLFAVSFTVPSNVPSMFHGTYQMNFQARTRDGATAERSVQVRFE